MKKIVLNVLLCITVSAGVKGQNNYSPEQLQVQKTIIEAFQGIAELNIDEIKRNCTSDIKILENGIVWNLDSLILKVNEKKLLDLKRTNKIDFIETEVKDNIAWVTYHNEADIVSNGNAGMIKWLESAVLLKEGNAWKIKLLHSTLVERIKK